MSPAPYSTYADKLSFTVDNYRSSLKNQINSTCNYFCISLSEWDQAITLKWCSLYPCFSNILSLMCESTTCSYSTGPNVYRSIFRLFLSTAMLNFILRRRVNKALCKLLPSEPQRKRHNLFCPHMIPQNIYTDLYK